MKHWKPYTPSPQMPWDRRRTIHLHRRTVFGASWGEIQRDLVDDPQSAVTRILNGQCRMEGVASDFERMANVIGKAAVESSSAERLKAWWIYRWLFSPHPLQERMTLMWHNHFATSNLKVADLNLMYLQNQTLRQHCFEKFGSLLKAMMRDPALLTWLDAPANKVGHPNENLARELMELFTIGVGHFTETDVKEVARALTGWTVNRGEFFVQSKLHDASEKNVLGKSGKFAGDDVLDKLISHSGTARRLVWRLSKEFFGDGVVSDEASDELANGLRERDLDIRWAIESMLRSELFFSDANVGHRVMDPASFLIAPLRAVECWNQRPSTLVLVEWLTRMGLDLFYPPNVGGWNGGKTWLSTRAVIARANYAVALSTGRLCHPTQPPMLEDLINRHVPRSQSGAKTEWLASLLCNDTNRELIEAANKASESIPEQKLSQVVVALLTRPEAQLH